MTQAINCLLFKRSACHVLIRRVRVRGRSNPHHPFLTGFLHSVAYLSLHRGRMFEKNVIFGLKTSELFLQINEDVRCLFVKFQDDIR